MLRIFASARFYYPGFKAGGPIRSLLNLVDNFSQEFSFHIVTSDRDSGDQEPYQGVARIAWHRVGSAQVCYAASGLCQPLRLAGLFSRTPHDILYLNSLFSPSFTLLPLLMRRLGLCKQAPVILAPRGELSPGALGLKKIKKSLFLYASKLIGLYRDAIWQATSEHEAANIRAWMGKDARIIVAPNLPSALIEGAVLAADVRRPGEALRLIFLSRISPKKNLELALRVLRSVKVPLKFSIYGPAEDKAYLDQCRRLAASLPGHIKVIWQGVVHPDEVAGVMARNDLFFLPTRGENYGHVIAEAISVGTPVLVADTTPWRNLEAAAVGWDLPLEDEAAFAERIEYCASIPNADYAAWRERVRGYARSRLAVDVIVEANRKLFLTAAGQVSTPVAGEP